MMSNATTGDPSRAGLSFGSVCSGIEAATVAWAPLGLSAAWLAEVEPFCCALLGHHYPHTPNLGDITKLTEADLERHGPIDVLVGGTPCQSFSDAGLRKGLADPRGNLALRFLQIATITRPIWVLWENVPGVLSVDKGRAFGAFLGGLVQLGYGFAYRILDAQYFGVPQRRRRVFVVGHLGDWRRAVSVLFERESLCRYPPPRREAGARVAGSLARGACSSHGRYDPNGEDYILPAITTELGAAGAGRLHDHYSVAYQCQGSNVGEMGTVRSGNQGVTGGVPFLVGQNGSDVQISETPGALGASQARQTSGDVLVQPNMAVRRLTPAECEKLQGFSPGYTKIPYRGKPADKCPDGPRYRALGNSMAVPVMAWIGRRIMETDT